ncbi:IS66 family transposase [Methylocaldum marinum]|uniref:IS66 family transposase n=1 Tax=Methylocaldum marinum TaxID=1432792 RepID=UPI000E68D454
MADDAPPSSIAPTVVCAGYDQVFTDGKIAEGACCANASCKFYDIARPADSGKRTSLHESFDFIGRLYVIKRVVKERQLDTKGIRTRRQKQERSTLGKLDAWLGERLRELPPKTPTAKASGYVLNYRQPPERYPKACGRNVDNNRGSHRIQPNPDLRGVGHQPGGSPDEKHAYTVTRDEAENIDIVDSSTL